MTHGISIIWSLQIFHYCLIFWFFSSITMFNSEITDRFMNFSVFIYGRMAERAKTYSVSFHRVLQSKKDLAAYVAKEIPSCELTCPFPRQFWRWVSLGYVNSLEGISSLLVMRRLSKRLLWESLGRHPVTPPEIWSFLGVCRVFKNTQPASFGGTGCVGREIPPFLAMMIGCLQKVVCIYIYIFFFNSRP